MKHVDFVMCIKICFINSRKRKLIPRLESVIFLVSLMFFCERDFISAHADYNFEFHSEVNLNFGTIFRLLKPFWEGRCTESLTQKLCPKDR